MTAQAQQAGMELFARMFGNASGGGGGGGGASAAQAVAFSNPWTAAAYSLMETAKTGNNSSSSGTLETANDHSGWNVNFGAGSITSSATREAASQWITILAGLAALLVAYKTLRG